MSSPRPAAASFQMEEVRTQLERIVQSRTFGGSEQLKRLLELVVNRSLEGQTALLKEYTLGLDVFQRPPDYDPKLDPIVRVQARRLRSKLEEYYSNEGARDSLLIEIPKGAYVPVFQARRGAAPARRRLFAVFAGVAGVVIVSLAVWAALRGATPAGPARSVAVLPLQMFTEDGAHSHIADQATEVLTTALAKSGRLRVVSRTTASRFRETRATLPEIARELGVRWVVEGGVGLESGRAYVKLRLVDSTSDRKAWADVFDCPLSEIVASSIHAADRIESAIIPRLRP